jgi:alkylhydroperoxidase family enzyme
MMKFLIRQFIRAFERRFSYDAAYMHEILDASPRAMRRLLLAQGMNLHRQGLPAAAWHAARIVAARHEDCGPCTQLVVDYALADGVDPDVLRGVVAGDCARLPADAALAARFAAAVLDHEPAETLRAEVLERFGPQGLVTLGYAIATTRIFPTLKRVMGHAHTCERVVIRGESIAAARAA